MERELDTVIRFVFPSKKGRRITDAHNAWNAACERAGCEGKTKHTLRYSAARSMVRSGISQSVAMKLGGWKTDSVFRRYVITDSAVLREAGAKLAAFHENGSKVAPEKRVLPFEQHGRSIVRAKTVGKP